MNARTALDAARPVLARLDAARGAEATKADLIAVWSAVEAALRSLVGDAPIGSQALVREARSRQALTFDQANALIALQAVREQLDRPGYQPTDADVNVARSAFLKLDAGLMTTPAPPSPYAPSASASPYAPGASASPSPSAATAPPAIVPPAPGLEPMMRPRRPWVVPVSVAALLIVIAIPVIVYFTRRDTSDFTAQGIGAYQRGDKLTASSDFERAARANPNDATPHVYLARMAREVGNYTVANQELQLALKADPRSLVGRREYGSLFLSQGDYNNARTWYAHALEVDPNDKSSQGWLGCTLIKLNRPDEAQRWLSRAGSGPWSACRNAAAPVAPGVTPP